MARRSGGGSQAPFGGSGEYKAQTDPSGSPGPVAVSGPPYASGGARFLAWIIDGFGIVVWFLAVGVVDSFILQTGEPYGYARGLSLFAGMVISYRVGFTLLWRGTPGKKLLGLYVVDQGGEEASASQVWGREIFYLIVTAIPIVGFINGLMVLLSANHRGIHDRMAETCVI